MPRIKLANWYGDKAPGEEIDVGDVLLKALRRDGRVAEVVDAPTQEQADEPAPEPVSAPAQEPAAQPESGRKRR
ncbi:hypothetical protein [Streptomyces bullii]|uniref:Uncharacterized protein n=1 Tax=Streptomyces bullii TaxID=349910 RepID=A0ABW0UME0_9ACTN